MRMLCGRRLAKGIAAAPSSEEVKSTAEASFRGIGRETGSIAVIVDFKEGANLGAR